MPEVLLLLLPVAALSGWLLGRREGTNRQAKRPELPADYFQGLNFLLNEEPDKAIEAFTRLAEVDSDTVETHLALGSLFRRRGEVDRAIRVHQNLMARPALARDQRTYALLELARDYMRAGLLDRAENLFREVVELDEHADRALHGLRDIYQQEKEWESAIDVTERLAELMQRSYAYEIAQFCCEKGDQAWRTGEPAAAVRAHYKRALNYDSRCVRATIALGDLAAKTGQTEAAQRAYKRVARQDIDYLPEVLDRLESCYREEGRAAAYRRYLETVLDDYEGAAVAVKLAGLIAEHQGRKQAIDFLAAQLRRRPSVSGLERLLALSLDENDGDERRHRDLRVLRELLTALMAERAPYRCGTCGFEAHQLYWQCPSCRGWGHVKPVRDVHRD